MLGVARLMTNAGGTSPEFAVAVGDPWQGKGVGAILMEHMMAIAKEMGIESIWGNVLAGNTYMLALARRLGFAISRVPGENYYELEMDLSKKSLNLLT